jgi:hypothetical protein
MKNGVLPRTDLGWKQIFLSVLDSRAVFWCSFRFTLLQHRNTVQYSYLGYARLTVKDLKAPCHSPNMATCPERVLTCHYLVILMDIYDCTVYIREVQFYNVLEFQWDT